MKKHIVIPIVVLFFTVATLSPVAALLAFEVAYLDRLYPGVEFEKSAVESLSSTVFTFTPSAGNNDLDQRQWTVTLSELGVSIDERATQEKLFSVGRSGDTISDFKTKLRAYRSGVTVAPVMVVDRDAVMSVVASVSAEVDIPVVEPKFRLVSGRVVEFQQGVPGRRVDRQLLASRIETSAVSGDGPFDVEIPITPLSPKQSEGDVSAASLGITQRLGTGVSRFKGSIASRKHNIAVTTKRIDGVLIRPGDTFSFNDTIGDVSSETGYQQAYIIKDGRTVLGDGGGVCQVSTTLFRAALNTGLPIVERRAHSYRVGYYEQNAPPGLDATVFAPTTDFKFTNDTPAYLLIQARADQSTDTLVIEFWGTPDGRVATTTKPTVSDVVPPPEDLYQDDPSLPAGTVKQVDWKAPGARVTFSYIVKKSGEIIYQKSFLSVYRPWQSVFLRGTGGV